LHYALDPHAFRWGKISKAVDGMLEGFAAAIAPVGMPQEKAI
jgi:hypothetical protein